MRLLLDSPGDEGAFVSFRPLVRRARAISLRLSLSLSLRSRSAHTMYCIIQQFPRILHYQY
jgi:hypothetical protein